MPYLLLDAHFCARCIRFSNNLECRVPIAGRLNTKSSLHHFSAISNGASGDYFINLLPMQQNAYAFKCAFIRNLTDVTGSNRALRHYPQLNWLRKQNTFYHLFLPTFYCFFFLLFSRIQCRYSAQIQWRENKNRSFHFYSF